MLGSAAAGRLGGTLVVAARDGGRAARKAAAALAPLRSGGLDVQIVDGSHDASDVGLVLIGVDSVLEPLAGAPALSSRHRARRAGQLDDREAELVEQVAKLAAD